MIPLCSGLTSRDRWNHSLAVYVIAKRALDLAMSQVDGPESRAILARRGFLRSACLWHDVGHPPFAHVGERTLNCLMSDHGGFESNAQSFRVYCFTRPGALFQSEVALSLIKAKSSEDSGKRILYSGSEHDLERALSVFTRADQHRFMDLRHLQRYTCVGASLIDLADDLVNATHDLHEILTSPVFSVDAQDQLRASINHLLQDCLRKDHHALANGVLQEDWQTLLPATAKRMSARLFATILRGLTWQRVSDYESPFLGSIVKLRSRYESILANIRKMISVTIRSSNRLLLEEHWQKHAVREAFIRAIQSDQASGDETMRQACDIVWSMDEAVIAPSATNTYPTEEVRSPSHVALPTRSADYDPLQFDR